MIHRVPPSNYHALINMKTCNLLCDLRKQLIESVKNNQENQQDGLPV